MARKKNSNNNRKPTSFSLEPLQENLTLAQQLAAFVSGAKEHAGEFPGEVVQKVIDDYLKQYDDLLPPLREAAEGASEERATLAEKASGLADAEASVAVKVDEFKLRHVIGELTEDEFQEKAAEARAELDPAELESTRDGIAAIDAILSEVGAVQHQVGQLRGVPLPPAPEPEPEPEAAPEPEPEAAPEAASEAAPEAAAAAPDATADGDAPGPDELGDAAYAAGGGEEWDVEKPAADAPAEASDDASADADASAEAEPAAKEPSADDMMATGVIQAKPELAGDAPPVHSTAEFGAKESIAPPPPGKGPRLAVTAPDAEEVVYPFTGDVMSLGRGRNNDIQIKNDGKISRYHCRIFRRGDEFIVEDNKSSNGTLVEGKLVTRQRLLGGELVQLGETRVRFFIN